LGNYQYGMIGSTVDSIRRYRKKKEEQAYQRGHGRMHYKKICRRLMLLLVTVRMQKVARDLSRGTLFYMEVKEDHLLISVCGVPAP